MCKQQQVNSMQRHLGTSTSMLGLRLLVASTVKCSLLADSSLQTSMHSAVLRMLQAGTHQPALSSKTPVHLDLTWEEAGPRCATYHCSATRMLRCNACRADFSFASDVFLRFATTGRHQGRGCCSEAELQTCASRRSTRPFFIPRRWLSPRTASLGADIRHCAEEGYEHIC
jgi:hypothetical protein